MLSVFFTVSFKISSALFRLFSIVNCFWVVSFCSLIEIPLRRSVYLPVRCLENKYPKFRLLDCLGVDNNDSLLYNHVLRLQMKQFLFQGFFLNMLLIKIGLGLGELISIF